MNQSVPHKTHGAARYRSVDIASRVEGASPQQLVSIMFDELAHAVASSAIAARRGQHHPFSKRALEIVEALDMTLDFENGDQVAISLSKIYKHIKNLLLAGDRQLKIECYDEVQEIVFEINTAWKRANYSPMHV
jgi:flagellar secretion chaperone FliS